MRWQLALDAADHALAAAHGPVHIADAEGRRRELVQERLGTAQLLTQLGRLTGVQPLPWLSSVPVTPKMLGLPDGVTACLYDLDGVLTDSGVLHAVAWAEVFDEFLLRLSETTGWHFIPFDRGSDYRDYIDGRARLEGVHSFLASRGIQLPEGRYGDPSNADTACGLARHKGEAMARGLHQRGVSAVPGARRYLEASGHAGLRPRGRLGQLEHVADPRARRARERRRRTRRRRRDSRRQVYAHAPLPTCCSMRAAGSALVPKTPSRSRTARRASPRAMPPG